MKTRKTYLKWIDEMGSMGFLNYEEHTILKNKINNRFNSMGYK